jgi:pimeloyl-ACP methyl ester carboxylesterase
MAFTVLDQAMRGHVDMSGHDHLYACFVQVLQEMGLGPGEKGLGEGRRLTTVFALVQVRQSILPGNPPPGGGPELQSLAMHPAPFTIHVPDPVLDDLRARILRTRWPDPAPGPAWQQGTDLEVLKRLLDAWVNAFDWRAAERAMNAFPHYRVEVDGVQVHFVHQRAAAGGGIPLILTHGWPSCFLEYLGLVPLLCDPGAFGRSGPAFDVVVPSLPGYGFSQRPAVATYASIARVWHQLMRGLGYARYGACGGDFGAGVTTYLALQEPGALLGIHLTTPELGPEPGPADPPLTAAEAAYAADLRRWDAVERGYSAVQSTRPQTLGYALNDSPAGLAAWILEKWRAWSDSGGDPETSLSQDFLLSLLTIYWATETITPSMRDYFDNRWHGDGLPPGARVGVPTGFANFHRNFVPEGSPPRSWLERLYDVRHWRDMPRGGHFAAVEAPDLLAQDLSEFFGQVADR